MNTVPTMPGGDVPRTTDPRHPSWCSGTHSADWPLHSVELGELMLSADASYAVELGQYGTDTPTVTVYHHTDESSELTNFSLEDAAYLSRLLALGVRLGSESPERADNPIVADVAKALRTLGAVTRTNADALLGLTVVELTERERAAVLASFAVEGGDR